MTNLIDSEDFSGDQKLQGPTIIFQRTIRHFSTYRNTFSIVLVLLGMTLNVTVSRVSSKGGITMCSGLLNSIIMPCEIV